MISGVRILDLEIAIGFLAPVLDPCTIAIAIFVPRGEMKVFIAFLERYPGRVMERLQLRMRVYGHPCMMYIDGIEQKYRGGSICGYSWYLSRGDVIARRCVCVCV